MQRAPCLPSKSNKARRILWNFLELWRVFEWNALREFLAWNALAGNCSWFESFWIILDHFGSFSSYSQDIWIDCLASQTSGSQALIRRLWTSEASSSDVSTSFLIQSLAWKDFNEITQVHLALIWQSLSTAIVRRNFPLRWAIIRTVARVRRPDWSELPMQRRMETSAAGRALEVSRSSTVEIGRTVSETAKQKKWKFWLPNWAQI